MLDSLPRHVWDIMLNEMLCNNPHVLQHLRAVSKGCHEFFEYYVNQAIKIRLKVPYITQPGTDLYVYLLDNDYCYAPMKWTNNHTWICDLLMLPSHLASLRYRYEAITTNDVTRSPKHRKTRRAEDGARTVNLVEFASRAGHKYLIGEEERWGVMTSLGDTPKYKNVMGYLPGCVIGVIDEKLISFSRN